MSPNEQICLTNSGSQCMPNRTKVDDSTPGPTAMCEGGPPAVPLLATTTARAPDSKATITASRAAVRPLGRALTVGRKASPSTVITAGIRGRLSSRPLRRPPDPTIPTESPEIRPTQ